MAPEPDVAAELERALARRVHLLAVALVGSSCLIYLGWLLTRPPSGASFAVAAVAGFGLVTALGSLAWARRSGGHAGANAGMSWIVFAAVSALAIAQGGIAGSAVWWLPLGPVLALQGGALRSGAAMALVMVAEMLLLHGLRARGWMPTPPLGATGDAQRFIAATVSGACMVVVVGLGLHWRRGVLRELQAALDSARDASAVKSRFLANMSHEIRTPLHGIVGAAELLRGTRLDEGQRQVLSVLRRSSAALLALVDDVLDFSKLEAGRMRAAHERFDLHDAIHDAAEVFSAQAEAKGVDLLSHCTADLPLTTVGDAARLRQILHNLVGNAVKFTERGEVRVFAAPEQGADGSPWVRVSVRDSGIGMDEAQLAGLFQAFAQADLSTTRRFGGTGLGLAIARELATLLGGRIEVQSQPGQGSTFMLLLPLVDSVAAPAPQPLLHDVEVRVASASRSRREDLADLVRRHGGRCSSFEALPEPNASMPAGQPRVLLCDARALESARLTPADLAGRLAASGERGVLLVGQTTDARSLPRELVPLYRPAAPARVLEAVQRALAPPAPDSARMDLDAGAPGGDGTRLVRVLLVEDNLVNQLVAQSLLERLGAQVVLAGDGEQALQRLAEQHFDLVLMDCQMPVLDGLDCTRRWRAIEAREARERVMVVAMTATTEAAARSACAEAGMDDFLSKPVEQARLAALLARIVPATAG
ncbi:ATP-binding protein [Piscinibacter sp.]|uniref:ATP-binding protein n=1 Tax=Piscinibacter sp. TaxID=1903157 RepID=UPI0035B49AEA